MRNESPLDGESTILRVVFIRQVFSLPDDSGTLTRVYLIQDRVVGCRRQISIKDDKVIEGRTEILEHPLGVMPGLRLMASLDEFFKLILVLSTEEPCCHV